MVQVSTVAVAGQRRAEVVSEDEGARHEARREGPEAAERRGVVRDSRRHRRPEVDQGGEHVVGDPCDLRL